ncbi:MAG: DUF4133 domain-containing protein [Allomuricauda sp.]|uniref:DUF4133 domain-containing protein n=1 Tax=Flagellimonas lutimaris TaxID=475082 RepID=UPI0033482EC9
MEDKFILIRKGLQKEVLFLGLKARYINHCIYIGLGVLSLGFILSMVIPTLMALVVTTCALFSMFATLLFHSRTYGARGFIKKMADASRPDKIKISRPHKNMPLWKG